MSYDQERKREADPGSRELRSEVVGLLQWMIRPRPHNQATGMGFGLRKQRLSRELRHFDALHMIKTRKPAGLDQLLCAGMIILARCRGHLPIQDKPFLVTPETFDDLLVQVEDQLSVLDREGGA